VIGAAAGHVYTVAWTAEGELFTFGWGYNGKLGGQLGHGGTQTELMPRLVEALAGKKAIGAAAGHVYTVAWTAAGEIFTFGNGGQGQLGHGGTPNESIPRLVQALVGEKVIGAAAGRPTHGSAPGHTAAWTDEGELFTFGNGDDGRLGHGGREDEHVPRLVDTL